MKRKKKKGRVDRAAVDRETLGDLLERFGIDEWDFLIVGDGSGSGWDRACGWAAVSVERETMERLDWDGAMNRGTVNTAEIMAYFQPLSWIVNRELDRRRGRSGRRRAYRIHIITDSQYCRDTGEADGKAPLKNSLFWSAFDSLARQGFCLYWHFARRDTVALNRYADRRSKVARIRYSQYNSPEQAGGESAYEVNPSG